MGQTTTSQTTMSQSTTASNSPLGQRAAVTPRWFSGNPDRAWAEKFFLYYSPVWMALMGMMMLTGWVSTFSDSALIIHSVLVAGPLLIIPALLHNRYSPQLRWYNSYWFKANLYMGVFGFFGNLIGSEYFFDVLGMVYNFPNATTTLSASLVGHNDQPVPLIMYLYTHAYFMTYHTTAIIVLRRLLSSGIPFPPLWFVPLVIIVGYVWAWIETKAMANPLMETQFYYTNMQAMLAYGSLIYALYFLVSFPIFYFLDEKVERRWSVMATLAAGLSASMLLMYLLELAAFWVGSL